MYAVCGHIKKSALELIFTWYCSELCVSGAQRMQHVVFHKTHCHRQGQQVVSAGYKRQRVTYTAYFVLIILLAGVAGVDL